VEEPAPPLLVTTFAEEDEARAAQLVALLGAQGVEAFSLFELDTAADRLPGHSVLLNREEDYARAAQIAAAFEAEYASVLDYMSAHGVEPAPPRRAGCGLF
jgi:hypothetical protein